MSVPGRPAVERFTNGQSIGIGSLPHLNADAAAAFSIGEFDIATIPTLPMRSPAEGMIAQAIAGLPGSVFLGSGGGAEGPELEQLVERPEDQQAGDRDSGGPASFSTGKRGRVNVHHIK